MTTALKISGMNCQHCLRAVTQALESVPGADAVTVDLASGLASVDGEAPTEALIAAVIAAGYDAEPA